MDAIHKLSENIHWTVLFKFSLQCLHEGTQIARWLLRNLTPEATSGVLQHPERMTRFPPPSCEADC